MKNQAEELLRFYAEAPIGLSLVDTGLRFVHINERLAEMNGLSVEAHLGRSIFDVIPAVAAGVADQLRYVIETGEPITGGTVEAETPATLGEKRCFQHNYYAVRSEAGAVVGVGCVVADITEQSRAEEALRASRADLASAQQLAHLGSWSWTIATGDVTGSDEVLRIYGRDPGERRFSYETFLDLVHPDDRAFVRQSVDAALGRQAPYDIEYRIVRPDGEERVLQTRGEVEFDAAGTPVKMHGTALDITERKRAREALRRSEELHRTVLENVLEGIVTIDEQGRVEIFNRAAERIFGYRADEIIGKNVKCLMPEPDEVNHDGYLERYLRTGEAGIIGLGREVVGRHKDGARIPVDLGISEVRFADQRVFVATTRDLTERKRFEEQLRHAQKLEALGHFSGSIAHDFNNILFPIATITEHCLDNRPVDGDLASQLGMILQAARRGQAMVDQILKFSRRHHAIQRPVELGAVVSEALDLSASTLPSSITLRRGVDDVGLLRGDADRVHEVVMNLISNAAQAIGKGPGVIEVSVRQTRIGDLPEAQSRRPQAGRYALLVVSDTGCGMDEATRSRIFDPFFTTKPAGEGTGLGLAAVHGIVADHGGFVTVSSQPEQGSRFEVYLPLLAEKDDPDSAAGAAGNDQEEPHSTASQRRSATQGATGRILVVDDEQPVRAALALLLEREGYEVSQAPDGVSALSLQRESPADLIVTDIVMPEMGGVALIAALREVDPGAKIIVVTGGGPRGLLDDLKHHESLRPDRVFIKPVDQGKFLATVSRLLPGTYTKSR